MIIRISGDRQKMAKLAHDIRMMGYKFNHALQNVSPNIVKDKQCMTLLEADGRLSYYKAAKVEEIYKDKDLKVHLPSHRKYFLNKIKETNYVERKTG